MQFKFLQSTEARLLGILQKLFPGAKRFMCLSELAQKHGYRLCSVDGGVQNISDHRGGIAALFNSREHHQWFTEKELPFEKSSSNDNEPHDLFGEMQGNVLSLVIHHKDERYLLIVFLNQNLGHFKPSRKQDFFSADNKSVIAYLSLQCIRIFLEEDEYNLAIFLDLKDQLKKMGMEHNTKDPILDPNLQYIQRMNLEFACNYLSKNLQKQVFILSPSAREKIKDYRGSLQGLEQAMSRALLMAINLSSPNDKGELIVEDWYFYTENIKKNDNVSSGTAVVLEDKYIKTYQLLERLEQAAIHVHQNSMTLTGSNIGKVMTKPISAPAISDALKQHKQKICFLFDRFPDRWETIRNHFRPIQNLFNDLREDLERSA